MNPAQEKDTKCDPVPLPNKSRNSQSKTQETINDLTASFNEYDNILSLTKTDPQIRKFSVRDGYTKEFYIPL